MTDFIAMKKQTQALLRGIVDAGGGDVGRAIAAAYHEEALWRGSHPLNEMRGTEAICAQVWKPLLAAMPDLERRDVILLAGETPVCDGSDPAVADGAPQTQVAAVGHYLGTFANDWLGIPATGGAMYLRYGEVHDVRDGKIVRSSVLVDMMDFLRQAGFWMLPPEMGSSEMWPAPISADGVVLAPSDAGESAASIQLVLDMHKSLQDYDDTQGLGRDGLLNMPQKQYWHPKMMWYGPSGIGTCRGLAGFVDVHQLPFRQALPNRLGVEHYVRFGEGKYAVTGGWPSVVVRHAAGDWMGMPPSGQELRMRVMDFYLCDGGLIRENWVPLDIIDVLRQMGTDVFARMQAMRRVRKV